MLLLGKPISAADAYSRFNMLVMGDYFQPFTDIAPQRQ
jgi:hypothetical protein